MNYIEAQNKTARAIATIIEVVGTMLVTGIVTLIQACIANRNEDDIRANVKTYVAEAVKEQLPVVIDQIANGNGPSQQI